jgi:hypothetical protein
MPSEHCAACGFDSGDWTDEAAIAALSAIGTRWAEAIAGLEPDALQRRPIPGTWSIAEYTDHVREVLFAMRFVLDSAVGDPGIDLGVPPEPAFSPEPVPVDVEVALGGIRREAGELVHRLGELTYTSWEATAVIGGDEVDVHWICRHAVHDAHHHLLDVARLRAALGVA